MQMRLLTHACRATVYAKFVVEVQQPALLAMIQANTTSCINRLVLIMQNALQ